jgi:hypothetical protein
MINIYTWPGEWGLTAQFFAHLFYQYLPYTANNFGLMYSRKRISQNSFPNLIYIFPKSFMIFCQELHSPKRNYENQICTKAPLGCHHEKKIRHHTLNLNSVPLKHQQVHILSLDHQSQIHNVPRKLSMSRSQLREQICQTRKSDRQELQSLVALNGTNIFLNGTNISFLKFICVILNQGMANSFWNHVIQISSRQMYFQDIYSNL